MAAEIRDADGAVLQLVSDVGGVGSVEITQPSWDATFEVPARARYVRAQLLGATGDVRSLTNPIWAEDL